MPSTELAVPALTSDEQIIVDSLLTSRALVTEVLPDDMKPDEIWKTLTACTKGIINYRKSVSILKPLVGRLTVILQERPEVYKGWGYDTFDDLMTRGLYEMLGIARSEAYAAKRLVELWPSLSVEDYRRVTYSKLTAISAFTSESKPEANQWLEIAQGSTLDELKDKIANRTGIPREDTDLVTITVVLSRTEREFWNEVRKSPRVHSVVGSESDSKIFSQALDALWSSVHSQEVAEA